MSVIYPLYILCDHKFDSITSTTITEFKRLANEKSVIGLNNLALCYELGISLEKDEEKAFNLYKLAADQGNDIALFNLGRCYEHGIGTFKNDTKACECYEKSAAQGNSYAQNNLGFNCRFEYDSDFKKVFTMLSLSAQSSNCFGQNNLGECYEYGYGTKIDIVQAEKLYTLSANQGNTLGLLNKMRLIERGINCARDHNLIYKICDSIPTSNAKFIGLARCFEKGFGVPKDEKKALEIYQKLAEKKILDGLYGVAKFTEKGKNVSQDNLKAIKLYEEIIAKDSYHFRALYRLGKLTHDNDSFRAPCQILLSTYGNYVPAMNSVFISLWKAKIMNNLAKFLIDKSLEQNDRTGLCYYGMLEEFHYNNFPKAVQCYSKSAELSSRIGMFNFARCLLFGIGIEHNITKAMWLLKNSAERGNLKSQLLLGLCFKFGPNDGPDWIQANHWFTLAIKQKEPIESYEMGIAFKDGKGFVKNERKAFHLFKLAADMKYIEAECSLAICYLEGSGIEQNIELGNAILNRCLDFKYLEADKFINDLIKKGSVALKNFKRISPIKT